MWWYIIIVGLIIFIICIAVGWFVTWLDDKCYWKAHAKKWDKYFDEYETRKK